MMLWNYHHDVRTTVTLDDDVKAKLDEAIRKNGKSFKEAVNFYLRLGLDAQNGMKKLKPFVVRARPLGLKPGFSYDNIEELIEQAEGPMHR
jgi:ribbon-helix-helix CopG family protein